MSGLSLQVDATVLEPLVRAIVVETIAALEKERADSQRHHADGAPQRLLLTPRETAEAMRISERTLWALTAPRGDLPCVRLGRMVLYDPVDCKAWIERHKTSRSAESGSHNGRPTRTAKRN